MKLKEISSKEFGTMLNDVLAKTINEGFSKYKNELEKEFNVKGTDFINIENEYRMYGSLFGRLFIGNLLEELLHDDEDKEKESEE